MKNSVYGISAACIWFTFVIAIAFCLCGCYGPANYSRYDWDGTRSRTKQTRCDAYSYNDVNFEEQVTVAK